MAPFAESPACLNPASSPIPASTTFAVRPPGDVEGDQPTETKCTAKGSGARTSRRVRPSDQPTGTVKFSVSTSSTPAARKACTAQSMASSAAGEPVTRPPITSVNWRRLLSSGDGPRAFLMMSGATSAQGLLIVQPPTPCGIFGSSGLGAGGNCAAATMARIAPPRRTIALRDVKRRDVIGCSFFCETDSLILAAGGDLSTSRFYEFFLAPFAMPSAILAT